MNCSSIVYHFVSRVGNIRKDVTKIQKINETCKKIWQFQ